MDKFIPKEKMSKKAKKKMAAEQRGTWAFSPVTRKIDSKKLYNVTTPQLTMQCLT